MDLSNKVAIVTGAGNGLGLAYARDLAEARAAVVLNDVDAAAVSAAVESIRAAGGRAVAQVGPIGSTEAAQSVVETAVSAFGRLDIMVTNAGIVRDNVLWKMTDSDFDDVIRVHLRGTFTCVRAAVIQMRAAGTGGRIVCVGSPTGQTGNVGQTNYAAAKAGIVGMVRGWALELARSNIAVNAVVPVAATSMTASVPFFQPFIGALRRGEALPEQISQSLGFGTAEQAAGLVTFLASDAADEITGQAIGIGGQRIALWSHPDQRAVAISADAWSADEIAAVWSEKFQPHLQPVGQRLPEPA
jgi:NAD(P)-dependent dehydrogenase (short-subunit alcohol dehydrogenase family)